MTDLTPRSPERPLLWPDAILDLADLLSEHDAPVHIVGGAVRDAYFGRPLKDADLITPTGAAVLARKIANALKGDVYVMDAERDVARVLIDTPRGRLNIDMAAYRGPDLLTDLTERDFTVNAMAVEVRDPSLLIDPLDGESDLKKKIIRRCTSHAIESDPIRALRAVRQGMQLSAHIETHTLADVRANAPRLSEVSPERVRDEFIKLLAGPRPHAALRVAAALGLLAPIMPEVARLDADRLTNALVVVEKVTLILDTISPARTDNTAATFSLGAMVVALDSFRSTLQAHINQSWPNERPHRALLYIAALLGEVVRAGLVDTISGFVERSADDLRLSSAERARLIAILDTPAAPLFDDASTDILTQHRYWHRLGEAGADVVILTLARYLADQSVDLNQDRWIAILERARTLLEAYFVRHQQVVAPPPLIDGSVLQTEFGLKPGPVIRQLLDHVREQQVVGAVTDSDSALEAAKRFLEQQENS